MIEYTKEMFKKFLLGEISIGYVPERVAQKAYCIDTEPSYNTSQEIKEILYSLEVMEMGEEFYISENEIHKIIQSLDS
ncbi:hypothetical protein FACS1894170_07130 [Planctomycetales bacterium]|nr:hypothetical protein FACS1894170_07130 [Planctomycetales bacterium]